MRKVANELRFAVYQPTLIFRNKEMDFSTWKDFVYKERPCMVIIEDIDRIYRGDKPVDPVNTVPFDQPLDFFSNNSSGIFFVITSNEKAEGKMKTWHDRGLVKVDAERLYTLDVGRLAPNLRIPSFQRGYVWTVSEAIGLLESIVLGYPIGSLTLWDPEGRGWGLSSQRLIVLDGQQRLSTLAGAVLSGGFGAVPRIGYDVIADVFIEILGEPAPAQILVGDMGDPRKLGYFWRSMLDYYPYTLRPSTSAAEEAARRDRLWGEIAPGVRFPRSRVARAQHAEALARLRAAEDADEKARTAAWATEHPGADEWVRRLDFVERRLRDHQTSVTVVRGGNIGDVREIFARLNAAGRPLDVEGVAALLGEEPCRVDSLVGGKNEET